MSESVNSKGVLRIDCDTCCNQRSEHCADCLVTFMCSAGESGGVVLQIDEARAVRSFARVGLIPASRHRSTG